VQSQASKTLIVETTSNKGLVLDKPRLTVKLRSNKGGGCSGRKKVESAADDLTQEVAIASSVTFTTVCVLGMNVIDSPILLHRTIVFEEVR